MTKTRKANEKTTEQHIFPITFIRRNMYGIDLRTLEENPIPEFAKPDDFLELPEDTADTTGADIRSYGAIIRQYIGLADAIDFIDHNWDRFVSHTKSRPQARASITENPADTSRYQLGVLAKTLKTVLSGTHPSQALQLCGSRGRPPLSPNNLDAENNLALFKIYVSGLVKAIAKNDGVTLLDAQMEVSFYFSGLGYSENTIKRWYDKYKTYTEILPDGYEAELADGESRKNFIANLEEVYADVLPKPNLNRRDSEIL